MTSELLQKANNINATVKELESFKKAFNNEFINFIKAVNFEGNKQCDKHMSIEKGGEIHNLINNYINRELEKLKTEFNNL